MVRKVFTLCATVSLLLAIFAGTMWWRSCNRWDDCFYANPPGRLWWARSGSRHFYLDWIKGYPEAEPLHWYAGAPGQRYSMTRPVLNTPAAGYAGKIYNWHFWGLNGEVGGVRIYNFGDKHQVTWFGRQSSYPTSPPTPSATLPYSMTAIPWWMVFSATIFVPLWWLALTARRYQIQKRTNRTGCCKSCGYDLRATATLCPECGTSISTGEVVTI